MTRLINALCLSMALCGVAWGETKPPELPKVPKVPEVKDLPMPREGGKTPQKLLASTTTGLALSQGDVTIDSKKRYVAIQATTDKPEMEVTWVVRSNTGVEYLQFDTEKLIVIFPNDADDSIDVLAFSSMVVDGKAKNVGPVRSVITVQKGTPPPQKKDPPPPDPKDPPPNPKDPPIPDPPTPDPPMARVHVSVIFNGQAPDQALSAILSAPVLAKYLEAGRTLLPRIWLGQLQGC
jgi:hypothetical protein